MKVGIITDTHDQQVLLVKAIEIFKEHNVDYIFHAGDITTASTVYALASIDHIKFIAVFGNCDCDRSSMECVVKDLKGEIQSGVYKGKLGNKKLLMAHDPRALGNMAETGDFDLVVYGHTHVQDIHRHSKTLVVNPGRSWVVILDLDSMDYEAIFLD